MVVRSWKIFKQTARGARKFLFLNWLLFRRLLCILALGIQILIDPLDLLGYVFPKAHRVDSVFPHIFMRLPKDVCSSRPARSRDTAGVVAAVWVPVLLGVMMWGAIAGAGAVARRGWVKATVQAEATLDQRRSLATLAPQQPAVLGDLRVDHVLHRQS